MSASLSMSALAPATSTSSVLVEIAGARLAARSDDPNIRLALSPASELFACHDADREPDIAVTIRSGDLSAPPRGLLRFDSGALWQLWHDDEGPLLRLSSPYFGAAPYKTVRLSQDWHRAEITVHEGYPHYRTPERATDPFEYPLDELMVTHWLGQGRGIELHASGIVDGAGRGFIFCGHSGAGKSTTARNWLAARGGTVLSDDRIVVRCHDGQFWMYGTPWHGEAQLAKAARAPLAGVLLIKQAPHTRLVDLAPAETVARLLSAAFFPLYDPAAAGFGIDCLTALAQNVPCRELELERNARFLDLLATL